MSRIVLMAESGSDVSPELAKEYDIEIVPMHVAFGGETRDDGSFPVTEMFDHYKKTHEPPRTSGCTPHDFEMAYAKVDEACADKQVLYLAYSAVTTCSMQSGVIARGDREDITIMDTKNVSAGQAAVVLRVAKYLKAHPETTMEELVAVANEAIEKVKMGFVPGDLDYLRAGGRVSNAAYLGAKILNLHPLIEIIDGKLMSTKKYRGSMARVIRQVLEEYPEANHFSKDELYLIYGEGLDEKIKREAEETMRQKGYAQINWVRTGCVIAAHSGPGAFGVVGFAE